MYVEDRFKKTFFTAALFWVILFESFDTKYFVSTAFNDGETTYTSSESFVNAVKVANYEVDAKLLQDVELPNQLAS